MKVTVGKVMWIWTAFCAVMAALFLTTATLPNAPKDEWILFVVAGALPWAVTWFAKWWKHGSDGD